MTRTISAVTLALALAVAGAACSGAATSHDETNTLSPGATAASARRVAETATARLAPTVAATATLASPATAAAEPHACAPPYPTGPATAATVFCADPSSMQAARVLRIVDGDTIHVLVDGVDETVRFYGIDTTEVGQPCSAEATARTRALVGTEVRLLPDARNRDRYGRLLRYVYNPAGLSIDAEMVDEGLAHAWRSDGALRVPIIELEDAAHVARRGCLWR